MDKDKFCTECGSKLPKVAKFCEECGVELALVQMKTTEEPKAEVAEPKVSEIEINEEPEEEEVISEMKPEKVKQGGFKADVKFLMIGFGIVSLIFASIFALAVFG